MAYSAPKGGEMSAMTGGARFEDLTYDGDLTSGAVSINGLGQLTDSFLGPNDFELADILDTSGEWFLISDFKLHKRWQLPFKYVRRC